MKITQYLRLFKFRYHISFIYVILGALIFTNQPFYTLIKPLLVVYLSFNVLLYGGLYTLNDIADIESDSKHPIKKNRPLPSKNISISSAYIFAFLCIFISLAIVFFYFGKNIFLMYLVFIFINQLYTRIAKKIPYVEILFNIISHPMRFFLGILLVSNKVPYFLLLAILLFTFGYSCIRRIIEKSSPGWQARSVLKYYTEKRLMILQILPLGFIIILSIIDYTSYGTWYIVIIILYIISIFGTYFPNYYRWLLLN